jgi:hypothetical protein
MDSLVMFADLAYEIAPVSGQSLRLQDPQIVRQYTEELLQQLEHHKLLDKVESLREASQSRTWTEEHEQLYQVVDRIITEAMLYAEKSVGKRYSSCYQWSPVLKATVQTLRYWHMRLKQLRQLPISMTKLQQYFA